jgi:hypothetical protein
MPSKTKTFTLALAASVLVALLAYEAASGPTARHVDRWSGKGGGRHAGRTRSKPRLGPELGERPEAIARAQGGQAGIGGGPPLTTEPSAVPDPDDDELVSEEEMPEDLSIYSWEPSPQFLERRKTWTDEAPDTTWAERLRSELAQRTGDRLHTAATLHQIDCRETICQLYLHAENAEDAEAIFATMSQDRIEVEHEQLAANVQLEDTPSGGTTYELVIRRDRPASMSPHVPGAALAYSEALAAREGIE